MGLFLSQLFRGGNLSKKTRKQELDQESDQENKKTRTRPRKKEKTFFFLITFLAEFLFSDFLVFFYKFPPLQMQNLLQLQRT